MQTSVLDQLRGYVISFRRELHAHPEVSGRELWTSKRIAKELKSLNIPFVVDAKHNVIGKIDNGPGKRIALRADFDALPIQEETNLPFASQNPGVMHACGHDGHVAGVMGAARMLVSLRNSWRGTVFLCFQMGEEINDGAKEVLAYLEQAGGVDLVLGTHMIPNLPAGTFAILEGSAMAGVAEWSLSVTGPGGHGAQPWNTVNPLLVISDIIRRITALNGNEINALEPFVVSPCSLHAGNADNIIPKQAKLAGTLRYFQESTLPRISKSIEKITSQIAASYGATAVFTLGAGCPPAINDASVAQKARAVAQSIGINVITMRDPLVVSDNISEYLARYKGLYYFSGVTPAGAQPLAIHTATYDIDEETIYDNARFMGTFAYDFLAGDWN